MLTGKMIVRVLQEDFSHLSAVYGIKRIGLFGSHAKDLADETSDVDLLVEFERPIGFKFMELSEYLESLFGCPVDILTPTGIQDIRIDYIAQDIQESIVYV